uniref:RsmD family RNA methyltransferase n=1 Tax=uncultured Akkermansia sp. TaxID=512294 RepID=UPI00260A5F0C
MRIISGKAGGITLSVPKGEVRPTTDRVREAVFSILNPLMDGADVLAVRGAFAALGESDRLVVGLSVFGGYNSR